MAFTSPTNHSRPETPLSSHQPITATTPLMNFESPVSLMDKEQTFATSLADTLQLPSSSDGPLLPVHTPPHKSKPIHRFSLSDLFDGSGCRELCPEIAVADITIANDGRFIESSSGTTIYELKRKYDQLAGVGSSIRTPYAITSYVSQHGKNMFRLGHRDETAAPGATAASVEEKIIQSKTTSEASQSPRTKRRSRLSLHFLPPAMFNKTPSSRPPTATSTTTSRKLRKTRSIPDMSSNGEGDIPAGIVGPTFSVTGRGHSQSVTAVDTPRHTTTFSVMPPGRKKDVFAEVMEWHTPSISSQFSAFSFSPDQTQDDQDRPTVPHPFGPGITFISPSSKSAIDRLPAPRHLREMQSFESGMTARQIDSRSSLPSNDSPVPSEPTISDSRPPSALSLTLTSLSDDDPTVFDVSETHVDINGHSTPSSLDVSKTHMDIDADIAPSAETQRLTSPHTIEVFNVLQTYRGLPSFEKLVPDSEGVIKLSLSADKSGAPRDDPRFVIWGEVQPEHDTDDYHATTRDSLTEFSASNTSSSVSKRKSIRASKLKTPEVPSVRLPPTEFEDRKVLLAATIERWIAQLTSTLDYDELLNFFLTYRNYVSAVDVCNFLICRFHWALQKLPSQQDEAVRRVVRVRTFVAIRYWLLTFFTVDFIPNRELRLLFADWLNTLIHDPFLKTHIDGIGIVRRLVKVAKECKRAHTRTIEKPKAFPQPKFLSDPPQQDSEGHLLGKSFAEAIKTEAIKKAAEEDDSDLDLDFLADDANFDDFPNGFPTDPANAHLTVNNAVKGTAISPSRPTSMPLNFFHRTEAPSFHAEGEISFVQNPNPVVLPIRHNSLSRAFVKTIGRIGRWKRVLNPKYSTRPPTSLAACGGASAFDLDISAARDMLTTHGGVEEYLMMAGPASSGRFAEQTAPLSQTQPLVQVSSEPILPPIPTMPSPLVPNMSPVSSDRVHPVSPGNIQNPPSVASEVTLPPTLDYSCPVPVPAEPTTTSDALDTLEQSEQDNDTSSKIRASLNSSYDHDGHQERAESFRSSSTDSFGAPLTSSGPLQPTFPGTHSQWQSQFDVVSIDDLDLSDTSSIPGGEDLREPPGLRKPLKKLPLRRDFEFVRQSEVSSMGIVSHDSLRDSVGSAHSEASPSSSPEPGPIRRWQMKTLQRTFDTCSNDSGDKGDVEDALRRLEGQINPKVLQEKAEKVDGWVRTMQQRMANGDYDDERSIFSEEEVENFIDELDPLASDPDIQSETVVPSIEEDASYKSDDALPSANTIVPNQKHDLSSTSEMEESSLYSKTPISASADAVPSTIIRGRPATADSVSTQFVPQSIETVLSSKFSTSKAFRVHQSFVHGYPAEELAQHFAMIDRELFIGVKFEELVSEHWMECEGIDVLDWSQFLKDRTRWKAELRFPEKTTALAALWARFNLMVNFVVSEIVLTPPSGRLALVSKFIRIAWRSYCLSNFNSLTAIIVALQNDWVARAMRRPGWNRISTKEARMYRDLKQFTANIDDFKFMRQVVDSIVDVEPLDTNSHATSVISDSQSRAGSENRLPSACIPFIGIYLTQLHRLNTLPAVIDPTAPHALSALDTVNSVFQSPLHPEVFSSLAPLPPSMSLEVLINVHKQRRIADVIKSLVAGQHLASRVYFNVDNKKLFQRCLRLRGLDDTYLQRALAMYPD